MASMNQWMPKGYRDLAKVISGNLVRNGLRGVFKLLVAGFLTPQAFGILRSVYSLFKMTTALADFGLDNSMVRFVAKCISEEKLQQKKAVLETVLVLKLIIIVCFLVVGLLAAEYVAHWILGDPNLILYVYLVFFAIGGQLLWKFLAGYLSSHQNFSMLAYFYITTPIIMLFIALVLIIQDRFDMHAGILIYLFTPLLTAIFWSPVLKHDVRVVPILSGALAKRITRFSRWIYLSNVASATRNHANILMLKSPWLSGNQEQGELSAGLYGFGQDLAGEITILSQSLLTILIPKTSAKSSIHEMKALLIKSYKHIVIFIVPIGLLVFLAEPLIQLLGIVLPRFLDYLPAVPVFMILYLGSLFAIAALPMQSVLYALGAPHVEANIQLLMVVFLVVSSLFLIPNYGHIGAASAVFMQRFAVFLLLLIYGLNHMNKLEARGGDEPKTKKD